MDMALWYITRGTACAALIALTVTVALGIYSSSGAARGRLRMHRGWLLEAHRSVTLAGILATAAHIVSMILSRHGGIDAMDILVPFQAPRTWAYGLGTLAVDLMLVAALTGWLRHRISLTVWRGLHSLAYLMWPLAVFHAVASGTDATSSWFPLIIGGCSFLVAGALAMRLWPNARTLRSSLTPHVNTPSAIAAPRYAVAPRMDDGSHTARHARTGEEMVGQR